MSFKPIKFSYTPPPTIPPISVLSPSTNPVGTAVSTSSAFGSSAAANSNAAALVTRLSDMNDTAAYLQQALLSLVQGLGVTFDFSANPDLARALSRIYNVTDAPTSMDMTMYTELLQTDINFLRFDLLNSPDSPVQIQPLQRADVSLASRAFENALISTGQYNQTLPILLRSLQGDQVIFDSLTNTLMGYPILSVPQLTPAQLATTQNPSGSSDRDLNGASVDVSNSLSEQLNGVLDQWQQSYAGIYQVVASPDPTETSLPSVVATLSTQPTSDLNRMIAMLQNLIAFQHQPAIKSAHDSVDNQLLPRLLSDVGSHAGNLDYLNQVAIGPSASFGGAIGTLQSAMASFNIGSILNVGITGSVSVAAGGFAPPPITAAQAATLSGIPEGLQLLSANLSWSQSASVRQSQTVSASIQRLSLRKLTNQGNTTEFLTSLKSLSSSLGIIQSIVKSGANTPTAVGNTTSLNTNAVTPNVGLQSFGTLVSSLSSQSGSSYAVDGNTLVVTPPAIPTAPTNVQAVLQSGGVKQITTQQLRVPINLSV